MKSPLCAKFEPLCDRDANHLVIIEGENRGLGRRGPPRVILVCDGHFPDVCKEAREAGDAFVWSRCEWAKGEELALQKSRE